MKLVINCTIDRIENGQLKSYEQDIIIENIRKRKNISRNTIVEYFYKRFKDLYLRSINRIKAV